MYENRRTAGQELAGKLQNYLNRDDVVVLGLARGGLPVADEVASMLKVPLDVFLVQKLGVPGHEELAMGAIASGGVRVMNENVVSQLDVDEDLIEQVIEHEQRELARREVTYRNGREGIELEGKVVILVDDGLATGASMRAAVKAVKSRQPKTTIVAVPTAPPDTCEDIEQYADEVICARTPTPFGGVGSWYDEFHQVNDQEVQLILEQADRPAAA